MRFIDSGLTFRFTRLPADVLVSFYLQIYVFAGEGSKRILQAGKSRNFNMLEKSGGESRKFNLMPHDENKCVLSIEMQSFSILKSNS